MENVKATRQYHLAAVGSAEPRNEALHSGRLPGDDVQQEALELLVGHVAVEEVGQGSEGITHEAEHGHVPERLPGGEAATEEELAEEGEGGALDQAVAEQQDTGGVGQGSHSLGGWLGPEYKVLGGRVMGGGQEGRGRGGLWDARRTSNCSSVSRVNSYSSSAESMSGFTKLLAALRCCRVSRRLLPPPRPPAPRPDPPLSLSGGMSRPAAVREYSAVLFTAGYTTRCWHLRLSLPHSPPLLPW